MCPTSQKKKNGWKPSFSIPAFLLSHPLSFSPSLTHTHTHTRTLSLSDPELTSASPLITHDKHKKQHIFEMKVWLEMLRTCEMILSSLAEKTKLTTTFATFEINIAPERTVFKALYLKSWYFYHIYTQDIELIKSTARLSQKSTFTKILQGKDHHRHCPLPYNLPTWYSSKALSSLQRLRSLLNN